MKIADLTPHPNNPRKISDEKLRMLKKSLEEFGDLSGIVFNKTTGKLIGGHQRIKILPKDAVITVDEKGYGHININGNLFTYREVEWNETKEKAANIAANQHGGEFDPLGLNEWLTELKELNYDLELTGFESKELEDLIKPINKLEPQCDEDEVPEVKEPITKPGDLWVLGGYYQCACGERHDL